MGKAVIPTFLLLLGSMVLGGTVMREPIARAAGSIPPVFVSNPKTSPVPVKEVNTDSNGNIMVHEQGTANVSVTNTKLSVDTGIRPFAKEIDFAFNSETLIDTVPAGQTFVLKSLRVYAFPNIDTNDLTSGNCQYSVTRPDGGGTISGAVTAFNLEPVSGEHTLVGKDETYLVFPAGYKLAVYCTASAASTFRLYASGDQIPTP